MTAPKDSYPDRSEKPDQVSAPLAHLAVGEAIVHSLQFELLLGEDPILPEGTLIHNTRYDPDVLSKIAKEGVRSHEATGNKNPNTGSAVPGTVYAYEVPGDMTVEQYGEYCASNPQNPESSPRIRSSMGQESSMYPATGSERKRTNNRGNVALIIDPEKVVAQSQPDYNGFQGRTRAFLDDIPSDAIAGLVLGDAIAADPTALSSLGEAFPGRAIFDARSVRIM